MYQKNKNKRILEKITKTLDIDKRFVYNTRPRTLGAT